MGTSLVTPPTAEAVTVAEARAQCRLTHTLNDGELEILILSAREWAEGYSRRVLMTQTWDYFLDGFPCEIELPFSPVQSITSITYIDVSGVTQTLSSAAYATDLSSIIARIQPATGYSWPGTKVAYNAVTVRLVAGYSSTAHPDMARFRAAMLMHIEAHFDRDGDSFDNLIAAAENLISPLRIIRF